MVRKPAEVTTAVAGSSFQRRENRAWRDWCNKVEHRPAEFIQFPDIAQQPVRHQPARRNLTSLCAVMEVAKAVRERLQKPVRVHCSFDARHWNILQRALREPVCDGVWQHSTPDATLLN